MRRAVPFRSQGEPHENTPRPCVSSNLAPYRGRCVRRAGAKIPSHPGHNRSGAESGRYRGKLFPDRVYFRGQVGTAQMRNAGGVRYADGFLVLAALVDSSGYASGIKEKYQTYLITDVAIEIGEQTLKPGAYGCGFIDKNKFVVMDLGANDLFEVASAKDAEIKRPLPLEFVAGSEPGKYRLYQGRDYVEFHRLK